MKRLVLSIVGVCVSLFALCQNRYMFIYTKLITKFAGDTLEARINDKQELVLYKNDMLISKVYVQQHEDVSKGWNEYVLLGDKRLSKPTKKKDFSSFEFINGRFYIYVKRMVGNYVIYVKMTKDAFEYYKRYSNIGHNDHSSHASHYSSR